jgi:hypothetical protein
MAKKRKPGRPPGGADVQATPKQADRHKLRKMLALPPRLHAQLAALAEQNSRPLSWEVRRILEQALRDAGLWPPPPEGA